MPGATEFSDRAITDRGGVSGNTLYWLVDKKFGLVCSLLLRRIWLPATIQSVARL